MALESLYNSPKFFTASSCAPGKNGVAKEEESISFLIGLVSGDFQGLLLAIKTLPQERVVQEVHDYAKQTRYWVFSSPRTSVHIILKNLATLS